MSELSNAAKHKEIRAYYRALFRAWGPQNWWPARSRFEVIVGAYLTQNTSWGNVEKALTNLRAGRLLSVKGVRGVSLAELEQRIRPSGYFRQKAQRLKTFVDFIDRLYGGSLTRLFAVPTSKLRQELLVLHGVGEETADSILLYAGNNSAFVVDAYTRRILLRHNIVSEKATYEDIRKLLENALAPLAETANPSERELLKDLPTGIPGPPHPPSTMSTAKRTAMAQVYNEMHGLIVAAGKNYCKKSQPQCDGCPLQPFLPRLK